MFEGTPEVSSYRQAQNYYTIIERNGGKTEGKTGP